MCVHICAISSQETQPWQAAATSQPTAVKNVVSSYTSTGTGSSPPPSATIPQFPEISKRPIWKVPDHDRPSSQPKNFESQRESLLKTDRPKAVRALQELIRECDSALTLQLQKFGMLLFSFRRRVWISVLIDVNSHLQRETAPRQWSSRDASHG